MRFAQTAALWLPEAINLVQASDHPPGNSERAREMSHAEHTCGVQWS